MKLVKAVSPYIHSNCCNFKNLPFEAWKSLGYPIAAPHYLWRWCNWFTYNHELPLWFKSDKEARLRFVSGYSIRYDTFPDYARYEVIPVVWDCWPAQVETVASFFERHNVRTAIFTSSQTADVFRECFPKMNILTITEGVNPEYYSQGLPLIERGIDILEVGRGWVEFFKTPLPEGVSHLKTGNFKRAFQTDEEFYAALADTKVTINVPRCDVDKEHAGDIETLTQRYWECMLSRIVMVGRAPRELIELIGYNPVVDWDGVDATPTVTTVLNHLENYQELVDRNRETALRMAPWSIRINQIVHFLLDNGYKI